MKLTVTTQTKQYPVIIEKGLLEKIPLMIAENFAGKKIAVITDSNVKKLYAEVLMQGLKDAGIEAHLMIVPPGEGSKTVDGAAGLYSRLAWQKFTRSDLVVALGGGVVGDLAGFVSATYLRGVGFIQIPTTLLSQFDSSVGGKVAVNLPEGKNLVGAFYQPLAVYTDPNTLKTLDDKQFSSGMAEMIKTGCIWDRELFDTIKTLAGRAGIMDNIEELLYKCCYSKGEVVAEDELDKGIRMILNYGHTFGHAVEAIHNFEGYSHGEAVAVGMAYITSVSEKMGLTKPGTAAEIIDILKLYNLPYEMPRMDFKKSMDTLLIDKKASSSGLSMILLEEIGKAYIHKVPINNIKDYMGDSFYGSKED